MANSKRENIIQAILSRLATVLTTKGFNTNIGNNVFRAYQKIDPDNLPCVVLFADRETNDEYYGKLQINFPITLEAMMEATAGTNPNVTAELMLADMKEIMESDVYRLTFAAGLSEIVSGTAILGKTSSAAGMVEVVVKQSGTWGVDAAGYLEIRRYTGTFTAGEIIKQSGVECATLGTVTGYSAKQKVFGNYINSFDYASGGTPFGDIHEKICKATVEYNIYYEHTAGNPY